LFHGPSVARDHDVDSWKPAPDSFVGGEDEEMAIMAKAEVGSLVGQDGPELGFGQQLGHAFGDDDVSVSSGYGERDGPTARGNADFEVLAIVMVDDAGRPAWECCALAKDDRSTD